MGQRGPPPKPTVLKLAAGNPGKRPLSLGEPVPPSGDPLPPSWLEGDARRAWDQLVPMLSASGLARSVDWGVLARYCWMFTRWVECRKLCEKGTTFPVKTKAGRIIAVKEMPYAAELRKLSVMLLQIEREFGLTPAARTRINIEHSKTATRDVDQLKAKFFGPRVVGGIRA